MKQQVSPVVAVVVVLVVIGIAAFAWIRLGSGGAGSLDGQKPPGMPPDVAAEIARRGAAVTGPKPTSAGGPQLSPGSPNLIPPPPPPSGGQ